jgi:hypothetical protein
VKGNKELARRLVHRQERDNVNIISTDRPPAKIMHKLSNIDTPKEENSNIFAPKPRPKGELINIHLFEEKDPHVVKIGADIPQRTHKSIMQLCQENVDLFVWTPDDMTGIPWEIEVTRRQRLVSYQTIHRSDRSFESYQRRERRQSGPMCINC